MDKFAFDPYFYVRELTDGIWEIWKSRCKALYENTQMNSSQILNIVHRQLHTICLNNIIKRKPTFGEANIIDRLLRLSSIERSGDLGLVGTDLEQVNIN